MLILFSLKTFIYYIFRFTCVIKSGLGIDDLGSYRVLNLLVRGVSSDKFMGLSSDL